MLHLIMTDVIRAYLYPERRPTALQRMKCTLKERLFGTDQCQNQQILVRSCKTPFRKLNAVYVLREQSVDDFRLGYPNLATYTNSSDNYALYRRFGYLQSRLLLEKQDVLRVLEQRLEAYDNDHVNSSFTRDLSADELMPRQALLEEIEHAFNAYGESQTIGE